MTGRREDELELMKSAIDLRAYAVDAFGFEIDPKRSSPNSTLMRGPSGDKIIVALGRDGHYIYASTGDPSDSGSIIDFAQQRGVGSLGQVRKALRPYIGQSPEITIRSSFTKLQPVERDIAAVRAAWEGMDVLSRGKHPYLNESRALAPELLAHPRFAPRIRNDARGNAVFVHLNRGGVSGFELKNTDFTGFSKGGAKGLWASTILEHDTELVIAESAVDALSHASLFPSPTARYVSLAGQVGPEGLELAQAAMAKLPGGTVVLAFDNDEGGDRLGAQFTKLFEAVGRQDHLTLRTVRPELRGMDWNQVLQSGNIQPSPPPEADTPSLG